MSIEVGHGWTGMRVARPSMPPHVPQALRVVCSTPTPQRQHTHQKLG